MTSRYEYIYQKRLARINYAFLCLFICLSMVSHLIAFRLVEIWGVPLFPSSLTYMMCFVIIDILATYNTVKFLWMVVIIESAANLILITTSHQVIYAPHPNFFTDADAYVVVFSPIVTLYVSNLIGSFIGFALNTILFIFFLKAKKLSFIISSFLSSFIVVIIYTTTTDYLSFSSQYPKQVTDLTLFNIISNLAVIASLIVPSRKIVFWINAYLNKGEC